MSPPLDWTAEKQATLSVSSTPLRSVRTLLLWLVLACLLPGVIGAGILFFHEYQNGRDQLERDTIQTTRALVQTVDNQLIKVQAIAQTLAGSRYLAEHDFAGFHRRASELLQITGVGINVVLSDESGVQIVNTLRPFGEPLPLRGNLEQVRRVFASGQPLISDIFISRVTASPVLAVYVPVVSNNKVVYVLGIGLSPQQINQILLSQGLPPDWIAAVFDSTGTFAARTHAPEQFVGQKGSPALVQRILAAPEGALKVITRDGIPVISFYSRSPLSNWSVAIGIPRQSLEAQLMRTVALLGLGIAMLFSVGGGLAWFMGGRIARSVKALMAPAIALEAGEALVISKVYFREADEVAQAMARTAHLLMQRTRALQESTAALQGSEVRHRTLVEWSPEAITIFQDGRVCYANAASIKLFGATGVQDLIDKSVLDLVHPDLLHIVQSRMKEMTDHGGSMPMIEEKVIKLDGTVIDVEDNSTSITYDGKLAILVSMHDITLRQQTQAAKRWAALLFANIQDGAVVTDRHGAILAINPAFTAITGYTEADILGENMRRLQSGRQDRSYYAQMWQTILTTGDWQGEIWNRRKNGEIYLGRLTIHAVFDSHGEVANYVSTSSDLTRLKHAQQMEHLAHHDALTGLPNRLQLMSRLNHALEVNKRHNSVGAVLFFDLDYFKAVNDNLGHPAGDELLQQVAGRISARMRDMDTLARLGGDEFVAVLERIEGPDNAATVASEVVRLLSQPFVLAGGQEARIGGSVGIAMFPTDGNSAEMLLRHADMALYRAKAEGRNTYRFYAESPGPIQNKFQPEITSK